jgi:hypothetical protein
MNTPHLNRVSDSVTRQITAQTKRLHKADCELQVVEQIMDLFREVTN